MAKSLDFNRIVMDTARMFGRTRKDIRIEENVEHGLWAVIADKNQIEQVLLNIYINAWQAMPDGGSVLIGAKNDAWALSRNRFPWSKSVPSCATYLTINDFFSGFH